MKYILRTQHGFSPTQIDFKIRSPKWVWVDFNYTEKKHSLAFIQHALKKCNIYLNPDYYKTKIKIIE